MALRSSVPKTVLEEMARQLGIEDEDLTKRPVLQTIPLITPVYILNLQRTLAPYGGDIDANVGATTLVNNTANLRLLTVPAGKRWYLFGGMIHNGDNVNRNVEVYVDDADNEPIFSVLRTQALNAGSKAFFPNSEAVVSQVGSGAYPFPLPAGSKITFYWYAGGVSAGGAAKSSCIVVEVDE